MSYLLLLPLLIPLTTAALLFLTMRHRRLQRGIAVVGAAALLAASSALLAMVWGRGILVLQLGDWAAPFGVTFVADTFSALMVTVASVMALAVVVYSFASIDPARERFGYYALLNVLLMGVSGAFLTGDLFNLYVWFEVMLMASFVLMALGGEKRQLQGAIKYMTLNLLSSAMFLAGVGILYGLAGSLNLADLAGKLSQTPHPGLVTTVSVLFLAAFGIKAAVFPLFFSVPASYHTPPVAVTTLFAALLSKVGVYALIRVFTLLFLKDDSWTQSVILVIAGLTMVTGVLGAVHQDEFRRLLSFHIVSQIGYMIMGLGILTPLALTGAIYFLIHNILAKSSLFLVSGLTFRQRGTFRLKHLGGMFQSSPWLAVLFLLPALSLAGLPPLSGFFGKLMLVRAGLEERAFVIVAVSLVVSLLTLYSMTKIWNEVFWKPAPEAVPGEVRETPEAGGRARLLWAPVVSLVILSVGLGVAAEPVLALATRAADQLLNTEAYVKAVLGAGS